MIFHNTLDGQFLNNELDIDVPRASESSIAGQISAWGFCACNSSSCTSYAHHFVDQNNSGQADRFCRDQIGTIQDVSTWPSGYTNPAPAQVGYEAFFWKNTQPGNVELPVQLQCPEGNGNMCSNQSTQIASNRDYAIYAASFNGTSGVGEGTLASRPSTCTTGVGYWATDQGSWNTSGNGYGQGQLYACTATNTWTLYYTPYAYPHPLQGNTTASIGAAGQVTVKGNIVIK